MAYYGNAPADVALVVGQDVITTTEIQDSTIATADIANDAITALKIDDDGTGFQMGSLGLGTAVSGSEKLTVGGTASFSSDLQAGKFKAYTASTTDPVLTLGDQGVADYNWTFPDTGTIRLSTNTSSDKTLDITNAGSGVFALNVEGTVTAGHNSKITSSSADTTFKIETTSGTTIFPVLDFVSSHSSVGAKIRQDGADVITIDNDQDVTFADDITVSGLTKTTKLFESAGGSGGQQAYSSSVTSSYRGGGLIRFFTDNNVSIFKFGNESAPYGGFFGTFAGYSPSGAELMILGIDGVNIGKNRNSEVIGLRCSTGGTLQSGAGAINATNADNWQSVVKSTTGGTISSGGGMGYFALGDNYTTSDAILQIRNDGNRGSKGHASGSALFKASFNDGDAFTIDKNGNYLMGGTGGGSIYFTPLQGNVGGISWGGTYGSAFTKLVNIDSHNWQDVAQISFNNASWGTVMFEIKFADEGSRAGIWVVSTQGYSGMTSLDTIVSHGELANSNLADNFQLAYVTTGNIKLQAKNWNSVGGMGALVTIIGGNRSSDNDIGITWLR